MNSKNTKIMKFLKISLIVIVLLVITLLALSWFVGAFDKATLNEGDVGPYQLVCVERYGDYKQTGSVTDSLYKALVTEGVETKYGFGIYYDKPGTKTTGELHSIVGCILEAADTSMIPYLSAKGFRIEPMGKTPSVIVEFPKRNNLSFIIGVFKAYPLLEKYSSENKLTPTAAMELYLEDKILYTMEIQN